MGNVKKHTRTSTKGKKYTVKRHSRKRMGSAWNIPKTDEQIKKIDDTLNEIMKLIKTLPEDMIDDLVQEIGDAQGFIVTLGEE